MACNPRRALWVNPPLRPWVVDSPEIRSGLTKHAGSLLGIDLGENLRGIIGLDASRAVVWRRRIKSASKSERRSLRTGRLAEWERHPAEAIRIAGLDNGPLPLDIASIPISRNDVDLVDGCSPFADRIFAFTLSAADRPDARIFNLGRNAARPDTPKRIDQIELYNNARGPGRPHAFLRAFRETKGEATRAAAGHPTSVAARLGRWTTE